jgi:hypothetical protein
MDDKIEEAIKYYKFKSKELLDCINASSSLTVDEVVETGNELAILEYKITALEVAKEN